jgi:hypothetical protein
VFRGGEGNGLRVRQHQISTAVTAKVGRIVVEMFTAVYRSRQTKEPVRFPVSE